MDACTLCDEPATCACTCCQHPECEPRCITCCGCANYPAGLTIACDGDECPAQRAATEAA